MRLRSASDNPTGTACTFWGCPSCPYTKAGETSRVRNNRNPLTRPGIERETGRHRGVPLSCMELVSAYNEDLERTRLPSSLRRFLRVGVWDEFKISCRQIEVLRLLIKC